MKIVDLWNMSYGFQKVIIRIGGSDCFKGEMDNIPIKLSNWYVLWVSAIEDELIIEIDIEDKK